MAHDSISREVEVRGAYRADGKTVTGLVGDVLRDIADLLRTELQLLRAELSEKVTFTAISLCIIAAGSLFLVVTIVLVLQAAIAELAAYGLSWSAASLLVAGVTFVLGGVMTWYGLNRLNIGHLAPSRTIDELQKDVDIVNMGQMK